MEADDVKKAVVDGINEYIQKKNSEISGGIQYSSDVQENYLSFSIEKIGNGFLIEKKGYKNIKMYAETRENALAVAIDLLK